MITTNDGVGTQSFVKTFNKLQQIRYAMSTGIVVDIQNIGKNTQLIAKRENESLQEIRPGVYMKKWVFTCADGNFSNVYDTFWNPQQEDLHASIHSADTPYYLLDTIKQDPATIGIINGSFFFLTDEADRTPKVLPYDLCIRDGKIFGLPSIDRPIAFIHDGKLQTKEPKAHGTIQIGKKIISWVGAQSMLRKKTSIAVLYNSRCCDIIKMREPKTGVQIGILNNTNITTPVSAHAFDIVIGQDKDGVLRITAVKEGGGTHFFDGLFILQIRGNRKEYQVGDRVFPKTLDGVKLSAISSAITIGYRIDDPFFLEPVRMYRRDARSLIAKDSKGYEHFIVFDGSKYIPGFNGVSSNDIVPYFAAENYQWVYFIDGGGSSRIIVKDKNKIQALANRFVFRKFKDGSHMWDWEKGRIVASSIALKVKGS